MDPASIVGIIGVAAQILKILQAYGGGVAECRDEVAGLRVELFCLKSALAQIERDALMSAANQSEEFKRMLYESQLLLETLARSLQPKGSPAQRLAQCLTWPLKRQHVKDLTTKLERLKTYFILVATNDTKYATRVFANSLEGIQRSLAEIKASEENKTTQAAVDAWLTLFDPEPSHRTALSVRTEGTNCWFLDDKLVDWVKGSARLLWLRGKPGSGKTCIAAACTSSLKAADTDALVAYFYCSYNNADSQQPRTVLASLLKQMLQNDCIVDANVQRAYKKDLKDQQYSASAAASIALLSELLVRNCTDTSRAVFFVIDAIDEAAEGAAEIAHALFTLASQCDRVRIVLTSTERMTGLIQEVSNDAGLSFMDVSISLENVGQDIGSYVRSRFLTDQLLSKLRPQLQGDIKNKIEQKHSGSFRWAQCTLDDLGRLATPKAINEAISSITPSLSNVYLTVLSSIPNSLSSFAWSMLVYLVSALRPLSLAELAEAAVFLSSTPDFGEDDRLIDPESIVSHLRCLVQYDPVAKQIELAHSSVRDFLTAEELSGEFHIDDMAAYRSMCRVCVEYLLLPAFQKPCSGKTELEEREKSWPLLRYATDMWAKHVRILGGFLPKDVQASISQFFAAAESTDGGHFAAWYQCMYPQRRANTWATKPLYICAREGLTDLLKVMLPTMTKEQLEERGGSRGSTALNVASAFGELEAVKLLLSAGANPNEPNDRGEHGIQWAWFWGHTEIVKALLLAGADPALVQWKSLHKSYPDNCLAKAAMFLSDLRQRGKQDTKPEDGEIENLSWRLALTSQTAGESQLQRLWEELASQDFKIPPRAQQGAEFAVSWNGK